MVPARYSCIGCPSTVVRDLLTFRRVLSSETCPTANAVEQALALAVAYSLTCFPEEPCGNGSLANPEGTLRDVRVAMAILQHAPLAMADDLEAKRALQVWLRILWARSSRRKRIPEDTVGF